MKKMKLQMLGLSVNDLLSREQMKKVMGGSGSGSGDGCSITQGQCSAPDIGAWTYYNPVCFSVCQQDVWTYCKHQWGNCY